MSDGETYWLRANIPGLAWTKVSKEEWIRAERRAGFRPKLSTRHQDYMRTCATAGFGTDTIKGRITRDGNPPEG